MKINLALISLFALSACTISIVERQPAAITPQEQAVLNNPPKELRNAIEMVVPQSSAELRASEAIALQNGRKLTEIEHTYATQIGVKHPDRIRIYFTDNFPINENDVGPKGEIVALTMNYGIFVKSKMMQPSSRYFEIITHEFAHVVQYERLGVDGMSRRFILETYVLNDKLIPIEREAIAMGNAVYDDPNTSYGF